MTPPKTNKRTNAADQAAAQNYAEPRTAAQIKVDNLLAQLKVLRRWLNNAKGEYAPGGVVIAHYVTLDNRWFLKPEARFPQFLPNSSLPWPGALKNAVYGTVESGVYYVFKDVGTVDAWPSPNRTIYDYQIKDAIASWQKKLSAAKDALTASKAVKPQEATTVGAPTTLPPNNGRFVTKADLDAQPVVTNVGSVREAYFSARTKAEDVANAIQRVVVTNGIPSIATDSGGNDRLGLNAPSPITEAAQLWLSAKGSKGMIQTYFPPNGYDDSNTDSSQAFDKTYDLTKYGFQFMYNPTTISMDYFGTQNVDVAYMMSGSDKFNYVPSSGNSGAITFQILINRIFDMQYYEPNGSGGGQLIAGAEKYYSPRAPYGSDWKSANTNLFDEQSAIYNKGTMYDVEYLLRTILGFKMKSALRREYTADMGFFSRKMVELHLGPKMRYRGYVNSLHIDHAMFNERMVPTLSRVSVTFNRFPDYANNNASGSSSSSTNATALAQAKSTSANSAEHMSAVNRLLRG